MLYEVITPEPVDGYTWSETMRTQAVDFGAAVMSSSVASVRKDGERFVVETGDGPIAAKAVVIATGAKHRHLGAKGEEEFAGRGVSYCATCDGPFFRGKRMIVVGGGDSACDEAMFLSKLADKVVMVHRKDRFRAQKAVAARVLSNPKIEVRFETVLDEIKGTKAVEAAVLRNLRSGEVEEVPTSAVFV